MTLVNWKNFVRNIVKNDFSWLMYGGLCVISGDFSRTLCIFSLVTPLGLWYNSRKAAVVHEPRYRTSYLWYHGCAAAGCGGCLKRYWE